MNRAAGALTLLLLTAPGAAQSAASRPRPEPLLVVLTPQAFAAELSGFVAWKRAHGLGVEVATLEAVTAGPGGDDAEKVKRWLFARKQAVPALRYVLLVGDADVFPVRYMVLDRVTEAAFDYAFYPSDLYYADLQKADGAFEDWNGARDGFHARYFGEVRGEKHKQGEINFDAIDYQPELAVGRWPVSTPEEVRRVAAKTLAYERAVLAGDKTLRRAATWAVPGWIECRPGMDSAASSLPESWAVDKHHFERISRDDFVKTLSEGVGLVLHAGHGEADRWDRCFDWSVLDTLQNQTLPILMSIGCTTGRFATLPPYEGYVDEQGVEQKGTNHGQVFTSPPPAPACYQRGKHNPPGIGELFVRKTAHGAVAYIGCNTGGQPCALTLLQGFCKALGAGAPRLGDAFAQGVSHYYATEKLAELRPNESWYPPSVFFQAMKYMLFGDPSLRLPRK